MKRRMILSAAVFDAIAKSLKLSFGVSRKSGICTFSPVTTSGSELKIANPVFFAIHPKSRLVTFCSRVVFLCSGMLLCGCSFFLNNPEADGKTVEADNGQYISFAQIPVNAVYSGQTVPGNRFELELGEDPSQGMTWRVTGYTIPQCLVNIRHESGGFWPFFRSMAVIEILPKRGGVSSVTLQCREKTVNILVNAL